MFALSTLPELLARPLPGIESHLKMAPRPNGLRYRPQQFDPSPDARTGAVLVALWADSQNQLHTLLTLRSGGLSHHGGQLSFPGGGTDPGETPWQTALREAHEEVHLHPEAAQHAGALSRLFIPPSNNLVFPQVAVVQDIDQLSTLVPNPAEVDSIVTIRLDDLLQPDALKLDDREHRGVRTVIPYWDVHTVPLWGATSMMLRELLDVLYPQP